MKKILSIAAASTFAALTLAQGANAAPVSTVKCTTDSCVVHNYNILGALGEDCSVNEIILNYLNSKGKLPSCIDLEKLEESFSGCLTDGCISEFFGGNCGNNSGGETGEEDSEEDTGKPGIQLPDFDIQDFLPDINLPEFSPPGTDKPEAEAPDAGTPDTEVPDTDIPEEDLPEADIPEIELPELPDSTPTPEAPENGGNNGGSGSTDNGNAPSYNGSYSEFAAEVVRLVNEERAAQGLSPVTASNSALSKAAAKRAEEQAQLFSHTRPSGQSWTTVLSEYGVSYRSAGENVAYGQTTPKEVMNAWMNSQGHRENILNANYTEIGVGVYKSGDTYYWSQLFIS